MACGLTQQIERWPGLRSRSRRFVKRAKARHERRRARADAECVPAYRRYRDWEF